MHLSPGPCSPPWSGRQRRFFFRAGRGFLPALSISIFGPKAAAACPRSPEFRIGIAEGRTLDVLPKKRADDPHKLPSMRCPSSTYECQAMQPLQDALLRPGVPENTLGRGRPRQALQEDKEGRRRRAVSRGYEVHGGRRSRCGGVRRGHGGPNVLYLYGGRPSAHRRRSRARMCVPHD